MHINDLDTPTLLIDLDRVEANLKRAQHYADAHGLKMRPHIKTHKLPRFAKRQVELGAHGITCQKLGEAEVMADAGIGDILVTYNILGNRKLERLAALHRRVAMSVVADSAETIAGYAHRFTDAAHPLTVLVECDTGAGRCGVQTPRQALKRALEVDAAPGLRFGGLMTYQPANRMGAVDDWLIGARALLHADGLEPHVVSAGGTPDMLRIANITAVTEMRPGTYIYSDRMQVGWGHGSLDDCAMTVLATVVSRPTETRAILDAGSKALAADTLAAPGHGHIVEYPDAVIVGLSEEHGVVDLSASAEKPTIGEKVRIVPNHACVVTNLFNEATLTLGPSVEESVAVVARGLMR